MINADTVSIGMSAVTLFTVLFMAWKIGWASSKFDSRITDAKSSAVRAHRRIDVVEERLNK